MLVSIRVLVLARRLYGGCDKHGEEPGNGQTEINLTAPTGTKLKWTLADIGCESENIWK